LAGRLRGCHILSCFGGKIMSRFEITQRIIEDGIKEKMENLENLRSWSKKFVSKQPKITHFEDFKGKAESITSAQLKKEQGYEYLQNMKKAIYIVWAPGFPSTWKQIDDDGGDFKKLKETTALPRINDESHWKHQEKESSTCLYVGSSHDIASRVIQHFWKCAKGTYALHLIEWNWWKERDKAQIDIWDASEIDDMHLQILEDIIWGEYKPLFGREGAR
jgi:hypothetical protein